MADALMVDEADGSRIVEVLAASGVFPSEVALHGLVLETVFLGMTVGGGDMSLVHAEYLKISRRKLYPVMVLILGLLVGLLAFFLLIFGKLAPGSADGRSRSSPNPMPIWSGPSRWLGQTWFPMILAVVFIGAELASTVWATSLTRDPRKPAPHRGPTARDHRRLLGGDAARHR